MPYFEHPFIFKTSTFYLSPGLHVISLQSTPLLSFFFIFFVYIPNAFPFPGSPLPISPISLLPSAHPPITLLLFLYPGTPLQCWIKPFQGQDPLLPSSSESFDMLIVKGQHLIGAGLQVLRFSPLSSRWEHGSI